MIRGIESKPNNDPCTKKIMVYMDGQNLFKGARDAFGYHTPDYDVLALGQYVADKIGGCVVDIYFYTGIHAPEVNWRLHRFWRTKLSRLERQGVKVYCQQLQYIRNATTGDIEEVREKGIDTAIAFDIALHTVENKFDVAVLFSQDTGDFGGIARKIKEIAQQQNRIIPLYSVFPYSKNMSCARGVKDTQWLKITKSEYDRCRER